MFHQALFLVAGLSVGIATSSETTALSVPSEASVRAEVEAAN